MRVKLTDWLNLLFRRRAPSKSEAFYIGQLAAEVFFKELAIQSGINLIANTLSMGEFLTYEKGQQVRKKNYYLLNVEPNQNQNASKFWRDVARTLVHENECLVVQRDLKFYIVDYFDVKESVFYENIYKNIVIGDLELDRTYQESEVFHFELHNQRIKAVIDGLYASYAKLISASQTNYKRNNTSKAVLEILTSYPKTDDADEELQLLLGERFKRFFEAEGPAIIPIDEGLKYKELENNVGKKSGADGREIRHFVDDIFDFVAMGLQIPPQLLRGNVVDTDKAVNNLLTFCVNPIAKVIDTEVNRKMYGQRLFVERTYCKLDTTRVKAVDLKDVANALDVLTRIGAYCIDDSLAALGMEPLNTEWSKQRWMTKNYEPIEKAAKGKE